MKARNARNGDAGRLETVNPLVIEEKQIEREKKETQNLIVDEIYSLATPRPVSQRD